MMTATKIRYHAPYYQSGENTTSRNDSGFCPARTCDHKHKSRESAERCASLHYPWTVYLVNSDGITTKPEAR